MVSPQSRTAVGDLPLIAPMLAVAGRTPEPHVAWSAEFKWDGVRALAYVAGHRVRVLSRNDRPLLARFPELEILSRLTDRAIVLDGEIVALDEHGRPDFGLLQRLPSRERGPRRAPVAYYVFDLLHLDGRSLLPVPYLERRMLLTALALPGEHAVQVPPSFPDTSPQVLLGVASDYGLEGVVAKRSAAPYRPGVRSPDWVKMPLRRTWEVVLGGWRPGRGRRAGTLGALLVGVYDQQAAGTDGAGRPALRYAGSVGTGTGWSAAGMARLVARLAPLGCATSPFVDGEVPEDQARDARWLRPVLVGEVTALGWTSAGRLRHPSFHDLREDVDPWSVRRDTT